MKVLLLAGGTGTRLWPVSRIFNPKQFTKFKGMGKSAFQAAIETARKITSTANIFIVTNKEYKYFVYGQLAEINIDVPEANIVLEPSFKNTLHAVSSGVFEIFKHSDENAKVLVIPSNSNISDYSYLFNSDVCNKDYHVDNKILTFGIKPSSVSASYGYIKPGNNYGEWFHVDKFVEKPNRNVAESLLAEGCFYNSGILLFDVKTYFETLKEIEPSLFNAFTTENNIETVYKIETAATIEHGMLEKTDNLAVIPINEVWDNLNEFSNFYKQYNEKKDEKGNISFGDEIFINSANNFIYSENDKAIGVIGVSDLVVIDQPDALLVCNNKDTEKVREIATTLKKRGDSRAEYHTTCYRPWGSFTVLEEGTGYKIKRITVLPGKKLSYQMHYHRSEHWVTVKGTAIVVKDGKELLVKAGESVFLSVGEKHRLENRGKTLLELIEVQIGSYLGEDDIVRFEDEYGR